ncbi:MAG: sporulation initiation factor Spo0A [Oscillospiraceae bacterium]|jgi:hypothetical protein|nr:sporulation initiation factor Spo0A [Oscillospiraceae bacterium]
MRSFETVLEKIARQEGVSPSDVYREMQLAIDASFDNPDPLIQAAWRSIPLKGKRPTPEDILTYYASKLSCRSALKT